MAESEFKRDFIQIECSGGNFNNDLYKGIDDTSAPKTEECGWKHSQKMPEGYKFKDIQKMRSSGLEMDLFVNIRKNMSFQTLPYGQNIRHHNSKTHQRSC